MSCYGSKERVNLKGKAYGVIIVSDIEISAGNEREGARKTKMKMEEKVGRFDLM
jgi:hypothetical protein